MNEKATKEIFKWLVDNRNRNFTNLQKEIIKKTVDEAKTPNELLAVVLATLK